MPVNGIFTTTVEVLGKSMDLRAKNQNLLSSNIANAETPNYTPKALDFEGELQSALKSGRKGRQVQTVTNPRHIPLAGKGVSRLDAVTGSVVERPAKTPGKDGNAVELENEMGRLAENQIMYNASVQMLNKQFSDLRIAIREGK